MDGKKWWMSKTLWLAIVQAIAGILAAVIMQNPAIGWAAGAKSVIDIIIRILTEQPVKK